MIYLIILNLVMVLHEKGLLNRKLNFFYVDFSVLVLRNFSMLCWNSMVSKENLLCSLLPDVRHYHQAVCLFSINKFILMNLHLGLANLRPRLAVARKVEADDNSYPSVNTCYHYLKLPDYSSEEILKLRLMTACKERGFYFN